MTPTQAYQALGLSPTAGPELVRSAFRRLAFENHPDRNRGSRESLVRFERISTARRVLDAKFRLDRDDLEAGECARCGRYACLRKAADQKRYCGSCIMSVGARIAFLPAPKIVVVGCGFAFACLCAATLFFATFLLTDRIEYTAATMGLAGVALISLAITAISVGFAVRSKKRHRFLV